MAKHDFESIKEFKKRHGLKRLVERFGISFTDIEYEEIVERIKNYDVKPIHISSHDGKSFHIFKIGRVRCIFLFDWEYEVILTVYRMTWWAKKSNGTWIRTKRKKKRKEIRAMNRELNLTKKL